MTAPIDDQTRTTGRKPRRLAGVLVVVMLVVGLGLMASAGWLWRLLAAFDDPPRARDLAPADVARDVARLLGHWDVFGPVPVVEPGYTDRMKSLAGRMRGINGHTMSGGWNGDGTDWYEVELSPDLAAELRAGLSRSTTVKPTTNLPFRDQSTPPWWPSQWPAGTQWYHRDKYLSYLVLPPSGTRAWSLNFRW